MSVVLAIEPDSSQADPLSSVVSAKLGAELALVTSVFAAIAAMNKRVPDLVLFGRDVSEEQRQKITTHLRSLGASDVRTLDIPPLADPTAPERSAFLKQIDACLSTTDEPVEPDSDLIAADIMLIEAEVEFRLKSELERIRAEAAKEQAGNDAPSLREDATATLAAQVEEARREAAFAVAREREAGASRARAEADAARASAIEEARTAAEAEAARRTLQAEVARVKAETDDQVRLAVARARTETEAQLREQVARATAETEARLEAQLASVRGEAEQVRHAHQQVTRETERIRAEAAEAARAEAEASLATETERIKREAEERLEREIAALREDAERRQAAELDKLRAQAGTAGQSASRSKTAFGSPVRWDLVRWDLVAVAAILLAAVGAGAVWLPRALSSASKTSSTWAGSATKIASDAASKAAGVAAAAAPTVKSVLKKAERVARPRGSDAKAQPGVEAAAGPAAGSSEPVLQGFLAAFSRIPMDLYADGRRIGSTEDGQLLLSPGTYKLQLVSRRFRYQSTVAVTIRPGQVTPYTLTLPSGQLRITTTPGAEVWVEGERVGVAPLEAIDVPIGTHEIVVKDPVLGERHQAVEVRYGETAQLTIMPPSDAQGQPPSVPHLAPLSQYQPKR